MTTQNFFIPAYRDRNGVSAFKSWSSLPPKGEQPDKSVIFDPPYEGITVKKTCFVALSLFVVFGIGGVLIATSIPYHTILEGLRKLSTKKIVIIGLSIGTATGIYIYGVGRVMYVVLTKPDPSFGKEMKPGKWIGNSHWIPARARRLGTDESDKTLLSGGIKIYLNVSTIDENGNGVVCGYLNKDCSEHYSKTAAVIATAPFYCAIAEIYNIIRTMVAPLYVAGCLVYEKVTERPLKSRFFKWQDIPTQLFISVRQATLAPFCAGAYLIFALYSLVDTKNGSDLMVRTERLWNRDKSSHEAFCPTLQEKLCGKFKKQPFFVGFEGKGDPDLMQGTTVCLPACFHPIVIVEFKNWEIVMANLSDDAIQKWKNYDSQNYPNYEEGDPFCVSFDPTLLPNIKIPAQFIAESV